MNVIQVEDLSKYYKLGSIGGQTLREDIHSIWDKVRGKNSELESGPQDGFWALKDMNFTVAEGDVLGIVGKNGAGKSTLLKILSKITAPTSGSIKIRGRVASLLEVGTGFHPELSGRENIFLNGAILGMTKHEIKSQFDEIVDFSGVEQFIDTPVKRYSSGMYVRLAFAVAAHLEPEILIIDEVLAVGDADFQKKCLGKMKDVAGHGRTVLFVSHNMAAVKSLCSKAILLEHGQLKCEGTTDEIVLQYLKAGSDLANHKTFPTQELAVDGLDILEIKIHAADKSPNDSIQEGEEILLETTYTLESTYSEKYHLTYHLYDELGEPMFSFSHARDNTPLQTGTHTVTCIFPARFFNTGTFYLSLFIIADKSRAARVEKDIASFTIANASQELGTWMGREPGYLKPSFKWTHKPVSR